MCWETVRGGPSVTSSPNSASPAPRFAARRTGLGVQPGRRLLSLLHGSDQFFPESLLVKLAPMTDELVEHDLPAVSSLLAEVLKADL
jgi:hypothetical protein